MKRIVLLMALAIVVAGGVFAEENYSLNLKTGFGFGNSFTLSSYSSFNNGLKLDLMADGSAKPLGGSPFVAGLMNVPFGLWSWRNKDWFGGGLTAGLEAVGIAFLVAFNTAPPSDTVYAMGLASLPLIIGGAIWGGRRGSKMYKEAAGLAEAYDPNPLKHASFTVLPTADGKNLAGNVAFAYSF